MSRSIVDVLLVVLALGALAIGAVLATVPAILPPGVLETIAGFEGSVETDRVLLAIGLVVGLFALWRSYFSGASDVRRAGVTRAPSHSMAATATTADGETPVDVVGERTSDRVEETISSLKRGDSTEPDGVIEELRSTLRSVEAARGHSRAATDDRIRRGEWTDDRIAAVFLGDDSAGTLSIWHRLRRWLFPGRTFERRLERTLAELERYAMAPEGAAMASQNGAMDPQDGAMEPQDGSAAREGDRREGRNETATRTAASGVDDAEDEYA